MTKSELAKEIYKAAHLKGEFLLRSGVISHEYFDKYQFEARPNLLKAIAEQIVPILPKNYDLMAALEMGGIPIATAISLLNGSELVFVRKEAKKYGTNKLAEGFDVAGKKLVIIEDVVTSGGQIVISANQLRELGATIDTAICVIDRESGGRENLEKDGINLISLFTMSEIKKEVGE